MDVLDFILDGLEAALELERELGVRSVEIDRGLLGVTTVPRLPSQVSSPSTKVGPKTEDARRETPTGLETRDARPAVVNRTIEQSSDSNEVIAKPRTVAASATSAGQRTGCYRACRGGRDGTVEGFAITSNIKELVFLHDRPLAPAGVEMMAKILNALGKPDAPIVVAPPVPQAKVTVVLGGLALKKYFPGMKGEPGQWQKTPEGRDVLITYSPAYILRFGSVTPAVEKIKKAMWTSLKAVRQRLSTS